MRRDRKIRPFPVNRKVSLSRQLDLYTWSRPVSSNLSGINFGGKGRGDWRDASRRIGLMGAGWEKCHPEGMAVEMNLRLWAAGFGAGCLRGAGLAPVAEVEGGRVTCGEGFHGRFLDEIARGRHARHRATGLRDGSGGDLLLDGFRHI